MATTSPMRLSPRLSVQQMMPIDVLKLKEDVSARDHQVKVLNDKLIVLEAKLRESKKEGLEAALAQKSHELSRSEQRAKKCLHDLQLKSKEADDLNLQLQANLDELKWMREKYKAQNDELEECVQRSRGMLEQIRTMESTVQQVQQLECDLSRITAENERLKAQLKSKSEHTSRSSGSPSSKEKKSARSKSLVGSTRHNIDIPLLKINSVVSSDHEDASSIINSPSEPVLDSPVGCEVREAATTEAAINAQPDGMVEVSGSHSTTNPAQASAAGNNTSPPHKRSSVRPKVSVPLSKSRKRSVGAVESTSSLHDSSSEPASHPRSKDSLRSEAPQIEDHPAVASTVGSTLIPVLPPITPRSPRPTDTVSSTEHDNRKRSSISKDPTTHRALRDAEKTLDAHAMVNQKLVQELDQTRIELATLQSQLVDSSSSKITSARGRPKIVIERTDDEKEREILLLKEMLRASQIDVNRLKNRVKSLTENAKPV
eukprot:GILK01004489.1.p1 GENE.GILK01004489.1~~GILK01004489.1.p1  ORF type:complete len:507 (+),score=95.77 GILK01004489.1:64-1521(+)